MERNALGIILSAILFGLLLSSFLQRCESFVIKRVDGVLASTIPKTHRYSSITSSSRSPESLLGNAGSGASNEFSTAAPTTFTNACEDRNLQDLKASVDIVSVVETFKVPKFRRSGSGAICCCPFHDDNNPSMSVDSKRQIYKCFSCGASGDVIQFVLDYTSLPGQEKLSFSQVLQFLDTTFGDGTYTASSTNKPNSKASSEQGEKERKRQQRCLLANAAAASFFTNTLTHISSGAARMYLRSRGVSPSTIRIFGIGYACDNRSSLIEHLKSENFTAAEIVDSGLAIVKRKHKEARQANMTLDHLDYNGIADLFNSRIMIPIMDETGKKVLGFGGRVISPDTSAPTFKAPKYLNTPESPVYQKKNILFGILIAKKSIEATVTISSKRPTIVLVEGYMDAIALWEAGYHFVAATMGTAVSQNQLDSAAKAVSSMGGRIVLCLDNDTAGITAMERLCGNGMLSQVSTKYKVEVLIASLPSGIKDPADYVTRYRGVKSFDEKFEREVIGAATDWINWYISLVIRQYDSKAPRGAMNSFGNIFSRVGEFIGTRLDVADRTKAALEVSHLLSALLSTERNGTKISKTVQIQLEADLIDAAARHSYSRDELSKRIDEKSLNSKESKLILSNLIRGDLSAEMSSEGNRPAPIRATEQLSEHSFFPNRKAKRSKRITKMRRTKLIEESLTPFFGGFEFIHKTDSEWLSRAIEAPTWKTPNSLVLGDPDADKLSSHCLGQPVYFNSVDFNGRQFLSSDAEQAGYTRAGRTPDKSFLNFGIASIVQLDFTHARETVENIVLRTLVSDAIARQTARDFLDSRPSFADTDHDIAWSHPNKKWLFEKLVYPDTANAIPCKEADETRFRLMQSDDVPLNAFHSDHTSTVDDAEDSMKEANIGNLDHLFAGKLSEEVKSDCFDFNIAEDRLDLLVQESLAKLLWVSASLRVENLLDRLRDNRLNFESKNVDSVALLVGLVDEKASIETACPESSVVDIPQEREMLILQSSNETNHNLQLVTSLRDAVNSANALKQSSSRIMVNIMDQSLSTGLGPNSVSMRKQLVDAVDEHIQFNVNFLTPSMDFSDSSDYDPSEGMEHEPFEETLEKIVDEWGDWLDDDFVWNSSESEAARSKAVTAFTARTSCEEEIQIDEFEEESLDSFNARIEKEYKAWAEI